MTVTEALGSMYMHERSLGHYLHYRAAKVVDIYKGGKGEFLLRNGCKRD